MIMLYNYTECVSLVCPAVKHSMAYYFMLSPGVPNIPEYVVSTNVEEVIMAYYDSNMSTYEPRQDWVKKIIKDDPQYWESRVHQCMDYQELFKAETEGFKQYQTAGMLIHVFPGFYLFSH